MRRMQLLLGGVVLFGAGYLVGTAELPLMERAVAWDDEPDLGVQVAEETQLKMRDAKLALQDAMDALETEGRYNSITDGVNAFLILSGGGDALDDLESGRGVDPETFAALYAGQVIPEVADHLSENDKKQLMYKGQVIRMYSKSRLEKAYALRDRFTNPGL